MLARFVVAALALAVIAACDRQGGAQQGGEQGPQLDAPALPSEPARQFTPTNDAARAATGALAVTMATEFADAAGGEAKEVLTLRGENGLILHAEIVEQMSPATQVQGQTLRALLGIPVQAPVVLVYRVTEEDKPENGQGLCGANAAAFVVVWEPAGPGEPVLKVLGLTGGAPGAASSRHCTTLEYTRA